MCNRDASSVPPARSDLFDASEQTTHTNAMLNDISYRRHVPTFNSAHYAVTSLAPHTHTLSPARTAILRLGWDLFFFLLFVLCFCVSWHLFRSGCALPLSPCFYSFSPLFFLRSRSLTFADAGRYCISARALTTYILFVSQTR